jgi:cell wall-associated NlpC family hydrolase
MLGEMYLLADAGSRLRQRIPRHKIMRSGPAGSADRRHPVSVLFSVLAVIGVTVSAALVTGCGKSASVSAPQAGLPSTRPAPAHQTGPVVPLLGGNADGGGRAMTVPVARTLPATRASAPAGSRSTSVAPLRGLRQADLLVVAPFSLSGQVRAAVSREPAVTGVVPVEAAKIMINGTYTAVLGVDPSTFRGYAAESTAASNPLWQGVADGGVAVSYTMGTLDRLSLGGEITAAGHRRERLPVVAFGTVGIGGVDAVVSDATATSLGVPAGNAIVISAPPSSVASLAVQIKKILPSGAAVEPLVTQVAGTSSAGLTPGIAASGDAMTTAQLTTALRAAESARGLPYVWGAAGPKSFDCSGLVQWAFAQAGVSMPRVAADQARTGAAVPVSQLEPGDLLFYHTDPTDPGYISHVAIYLGNGWMIQAPEPGMDVEVVPASFGAQFAGAIRVYPQVAAQLAGDPA